ncbi:hypothetical protein BRE01_60200 [Brevibacillus reuszeri]|uniref:Uncharacterized protein n=1 Tax=Brevibacillus reuszeri TaxID=54915 RepID=A0A0K9YNI1_9BACL|nr:hypothetical protein [Brevibacillus reuszeri]KNB70231.1 hypothetical protein ADS79_14790 [Brevibacillus reuszeri]MED1859187.1 hypothetical protein [Brevibacillus reuszeri]GED72318.1 hypothetical protein BRE01_60200 [Brevibacillus reuszeri]
MLLIECDGYDRYLVKEVDNLDELREYSQKNLPIKCYELGHRYKKGIYLFEELFEESVYLSNYKSVYEISGLLMDDQEFDELENSVCLNCKWCESTFRATWECKYIPLEDGSCKKYEEKILSKIKKWMKINF